MEPAAVSVIAIVKGALRIVERGSYVPSNSPALDKLREAVYDIVEELEKAAKREAEREVEESPMPCS